MKLLELVNIKQGTDSKSRFSNGNTLPIVQIPYGFAAFAPQTDSSRGNWFYHPTDRSFEGIRLTRQPSPWIGEQGAICILPQRDIPYERPGMRWSGFRPGDAVLQPHYMRFDLLRARAEIELTPTNSGACLRVSYKDTQKDNFISVLPVDMHCDYCVQDNVVSGYTECVSLQKERKNAKVYFVLEFSNDAISDVIVREDSAHIKLSQKVTEIKFSTSLISVEQAMINLKREHTYKDFEDLKQKNESIWEEYLSRISIETDDKDVLRTFYSCMYRFLLYPHKAYELDTDGNPIHYSPGKDCVVEGYHYTDNGFWDTYRTVYSMMALVDFDEYKQIVNSFITDYKNDGWLPRWTATEPKYCMPSTMIDAVLTDAAKRGALSNENLEIALEAMIKHANVPSEYKEFGRCGCVEYTQLGYVPNDEYNESVNLTLDAAYGDWCIAEIASQLGKCDIATEYYRRSKNYKNIFDYETGFMRSRNKCGKFRDEFFSESWGLDYTEASAYQTSFAVQHDFEGLAELHGGKEKFIKKLDEFFETPPIYLPGGYKNEIHEMTEMAAADWGQCAISNQPSFHIPFIYAYFGETKKCEYWIEKICREGFSWRDDGFPGDEDNGTMACWYMFCCMGIYPLTPGKTEFIKFNGLVNNTKINEIPLERLVIGK